MKTAVVIGITLLFLSACASNRLSHEEKNLIIEDFISSENLEKTSSVSTFSLDSWTPLNDQYIILRTSPFRSYLVKLFMRCNNLDFSYSLLVHSRTPNILSAGFDSVFTPNDAQFKCNINRIYPLSREQNKALLLALKPQDESSDEENAEAESGSSKVADEVVTQ